MQVADDSKLSLWQIAIEQLRHLTNTRGGNSRLDFRGQPESALRAVSSKTNNAFLSSRAMTPWIAMVVSNWERIKRYCTISPCSIYARLSPESWPRWEKSDRRTSRSSSKPVSLLTDSQCGLAPIRQSMCLHRSTCGVHRAPKACLWMLLWRSDYCSVYLRTSLSAHALTTVCICRLCNTNGRVHNTHTHTYR